ncbi:MAG: hypothetical protein K8R63_00520 [Bacteroidales bacterium]|nr:hypothetical protein [Bacteroidales bacterium]
MGAIFNGMQHFSKNKKIKMLSKLYWDMDVEPEQLYRMLYGKIDGIGQIKRTDLYARLLATYDWYTLLKLVPAENLKHALSDQVIKRIYPKGLKDRFIYAREVLSK